MLTAMLRVGVIAIAVCAIAACRDPQLEQIKAIRDEVCACRDAKCGEDALKKMPTLEGNPSHRARVLANEMTTCMSKLYLKPEEEDQEDPPTDAGAEPDASDPGSADPASARTP